MCDVTWVAQVWAPAAAAWPPARTPSGSLTHRFPSGLNYKSHGVLPKAPYKSPEGAIVHSCRAVHEVVHPRIAVIRRRAKAAQPPSPR